MKSIPAVLALSFLAGPAFGADCAGRNLIAALSADDRDWLEAQTANVPHHDGILWRAEKDAARMVLVGTYHFDHPIHAATMARIADDLASADRLLVELGPKEEAELKQAMLSDPTLTVDPDGPTLPERMGAAEWSQVSEAMEARGVPAIIASKMRPWYLATLLGLSPCMLRGMTAADAPRGLDWQMIGRAEDLGIPVAALEPWDTVLTMFGSMTPQEEIDMIVYTLPAASHADDYTVTMSDAYRDGDVWKIWEFGRLEAYRSSGLPRAEVDRLTDEAEQILMIARNRAWIAPLTEAAQVAAGKGKGIVAGFGALHLPGEQGVLRLLEQDGWTVERIE